MPLVTASQFPGLFANPNWSGLARGIENALKDSRDAKIQSQKEETLNLGLQFKAIKDLKTLPEKRKHLAVLGQDLFKKGVDISTIENMLTLDIDQLDTALTKRWLDAVAVSDQAGKMLTAGVEGLTNPANFQRGSTRYAKDTKGKLFVLSDTFDPNNAETWGNITPVRAGDKPEGLLTLVGGTGETPEEKTSRKGKETELVEGIRTEQAEQRTLNELDARIEKEPVLAEKKKLGEQRAELIGESFDRAANLRAGIPRLERAIEIVTEDPSITGPIIRYFPSFSRAAVELDHIQRQLGLDVIAMGKFGPLSEGELRLALEVGLPDGLQGQALIDHLKDKKAATEALAYELENYAIFLQEGGTRAEWIQSQRGTDTPKYQEGQTATGPNGEKLIYRGGQWLPL